MVSVICLCHNQDRFVAEAIQSAWDQDYPNIELVVVDDASKDESKSVIHKMLEGSNTVFISLEENVGNCKAFNIGFQKSHGAYIIDLAADDILLPNRISKGVEGFNQSDIGVHFSDCFFIDEKGNLIGTHYKRDGSGKLIENVPQGNIYHELIQRYFISPPTMMIKRDVLEQLGGYDETLYYEDFDFWVRSSRNFSYGFSDEILVKKRVVGGSHSSSQFRFRNKHQKSTLRVCQKIKGLNQSEVENKALKKRVWYEIRQCARQGNWELIPSFIQLLP